jgi:hypothetical protein
MALFLLRMHLKPIPSFLCRHFITATKPGIQAIFKARLGLLTPRAARKALRWARLGSGFEVPAARASGP